MPIDTSHVVITQIKMGGSPRYYFAAESGLAEWPECFDSGFGSVQEFGPGQVNLGPDACTYRWRLGEICIRWSLIM